MTKKQTKEKKKSFWYGIIVIIIAIILINYQYNWKEKNCELTFNTYTYSDGCSSACSSKCLDEGFSWLSSSYFEPYLSYEEMVDINLYKKCECNCGGCREWSLYN